MEALEAPPPPFQPEAPQHVETVLGRLAVVLSEMDNLREESQQLVTEARAYGATWSDIGEITGVSEQAAYQRYSEKGREANRRNQRKRRSVS